MTRKTLTIRVDEETGKQLDEIMKAKRWGPQVLGEVMIEHYLKSVQVARQAATRKQDQVQGDGN